MWILSYERPSALAAACVPVPGGAHPLGSAASAHAMSVGIAALRQRGPSSGTGQLQAQQVRLPGVNDPAFAGPLAERNTERNVGRNVRLSTKVAMNAGGDVRGIPPRGKPV